MSSSNNRESRMEALPEAILQYIISHISNARDVANCNCISKRWKDSTPFISSLDFARNSFENLTSDPNTIITRLISSIVYLEHLVVYCPFSAEALLTWLSTTNHSLRHLELRLDNLSDKTLTDPSKLDCIDTARSLESLKKGKRFKGSYGNSRPKKKEMIERLQEKVEVPPSTPWPLPFKLI